MNVGWVAKRRLYDAPVSQSLCRAQPDLLQFLDGDGPEVVHEKGNNPAQKPAGRAAVIADV